MIMMEMMLMMTMIMIMMIGMQCNDQRMLTILVIGIYNAMIRTKMVRIMMI